MNDCTVSNIVYATGARSSSVPTDRPDGSVRHAVPDELDQHRQHGPLAGAEPLDDEGQQELRIDVEQSLQQWVLDAGLDRPDRRLHEVLPAGRPVCGAGGGRRHHALHLARE